MIDFQTFLMPLPGKVNEAVVENEDGSYTIFIEETLSPEYRKKTFLHALKHLTGNDFEKFDIQEIEHEAHRPDQENGQNDIPG